MADANRYSTNPDHYDLRLPPPAPVLLGDERSVGLLADSEIRGGLQDANDKITAYYDDLRASGQAVHELFRGATASGAGVAVAECDDARAVESIDPQNYRSRYPFFDGPDKKYVVFEYPLDGLDTEEGQRLATRPREVQSVDRDRGDGTKTLAFEVSGDSAMVKIALSVHANSTIFGEKVVDFREAALGERRVMAAVRSLEWLFQARRMIRVYSRGTRERESWEARAAKVNAFHTVCLDELLQHPEWMDDAPQAFDLGGVVHPEEVRLMQDTEETKEYKNRGVDGRLGLVKDALQRRRWALLDQFKPENL